MPGTASRPSSNAPSSTSASQSPISYPYVNLLHARSFMVGENSLQPKQNIFLYTTPCLPNGIVMLLQYSCIVVLYNRELSSVHSDISVSCRTHSLVVLCGGRHSITHDIVIMFARKEEMLLAALNNSINAQTSLHDSVARFHGILAVSSRLHCAHK